MNKALVILAIDTSCDETSVAITRGHEVLSNVISSQVRYHKKYGGVVPFLAQRLHRERIDAVVELALRRAGLEMKDIEAVAVTRGPGLAPALEVGIEKAKILVAEFKLPLYAVNHMAGHLAACFAMPAATNRQEPGYPLLAVLVSGGHTELVYSEKFGNFRLIGQTLDDALGEAYDKVAKMLGLGYPGGRILARLADEGSETAYPLPIPMQKSKDLNFSYSGLKNAVRLLLSDLRGAEVTTAKGGEAVEGRSLNADEVRDVAASFQSVAQEAVVMKVKKALEEFPEGKSLLLAGGVAANTALRKKLRKLSKEEGINLTVPYSLKLCTDNAAMIGVAAYLGMEEGQKPVQATDLDRRPSLTIEELT